MKLRSIWLLVTLALSLLLPPLTADAQQPAGKMPKIGLLLPTSGPTDPESTFMQGLRDLGWVEGRNIAIEPRYAAGKVERFPEFAAELVRFGVDVITAWSPPAVVAAKGATDTIPIVGIAMGSPLEMGWIASLARPGGNLTGLMLFPLDVEQLNSKRLELLKEAVPRATRVAVLANPTIAGTPDTVRSINAAAGSLRIRVEVFYVSNPTDFENVFGEMNKRRAGALLVLADPMFWVYRAEIVKMAAKAHLPAMHWSREYVEVGGLMSYATSLSDLGRRAATYVDKILKGTKPADLPVEQPTKFELVINLKTAKALGLTIPQSVLVRADHVIQ